MTVMEGLIGTNFIRYVSNHMQRVIEVTIYQAGSSPDWTGYQLPTAAYGSARQMMLTLSNIASLNNAGSNGQEHISYTVEDFLAGMATMQRFNTTCNIALLVKSMICLSGF